MSNPHPSSVKVNNPSTKTEPTKTIKGKQSTSAPAQTRTVNDYEIRWKSLLGLTMIAVELALNTGFIWGLLGLFWVITNIQTGQTYILEALHRTNNPILFWITVWLWMGFAAYFFYSNHWLFQKLEQSLIWLFKLIL